MHAVDPMRTQLASWLPNLADALVIAGVAAVLGRIVMGPVAKRFRDPAHGRMVGRFAAAVIWGLGAAAALGQVGVPASVTLPILGTVVVLGGAVLVLLVGPRLPGLVRRRRGSDSPEVQEQRTAARGQAQAYRRGRQDALRNQRLSHDSWPR